MVPASGVSRDEAGRPVVLVLDGKNKVQQRKIKTSRLIGSRWLVTDGLAAGDRVIVQGMEKAIPGATVKPRRVTIGAAKSSPPIAKGGCSPCPNFSDRKRVVSGKEVYG